jgi:ATP synthase protein I
LAGSFAGMSHALEAPRFVKRGRTWKDGMAENEPWQDPKSSQDARLASLDERLRQAQADEAARTGKARVTARKGQKQGMRVLSDLIGIPFGAGLIGWLIDRWLGTMPAVMLTMLFLGFGIAVRNVMRMSKERPE